jgi:putative methionine-R-sulfoxide reductase with GAF domain
VGAGRGPYGEMTIDATEREHRARAGSTNTADWAATSKWAHALAAQIGQEQPTQHVAIFVPDDDGNGLRLAAQVWGAGEDTGQVIVGEWIVPLEGSVCGRVYRTGLAALCADVTMDPDYRSFPGGRTRSSLTVPIGPPDGVVAVINLEAPWVGAFSIRDYERMTDRAAAAYDVFPVRRIA